MKFLSYADIHLYKDPVKYNTIFYSYSNSILDILLLLDSTSRNILDTNFFYQIYICC